MRFSFPSFARWRSGALVAFARFPWNILCGAYGAACLIVMLHTEHDDWVEGQCARLLMAAALGMPLFFSLRILRERTAALSRWPVEIAGLVLLVCWILTQPARPTDGPGIIWIRWLLLLAAFHFVAAISANLWRKERRGFWQLNRRLFARFCLATLYTVVLTAGLELAMLSADKLFQLKFEKEYGDLFFLMVGLFHPTFFLAGVPRDFDALDADTDYPRGLKGFTQFALAPLVAVYTAILYAYAIKILIERSWPHGWVALPVILLSGIGILAFLLLSPLRDKPEEKWARWFTTNFPRALAPLSVLLLLSVDVRVRQYGVTEERYIGIVAALWILAWALVFVVRRNANIWWIPASLAIVALFAAFGPLSAGAISRASQVSRLRQILQTRGMWQQNHAHASTGRVNLPKEDETNLQATLDYLIRVHGGKAIAPIFDPFVLHRDWDKVKTWEGSHDIMAALNISTPATFEYVFNVHRKSDNFVAIDGFARLWRPRVYNYSNWEPVKCDDLNIGLDHGALKLQTPLDHQPELIPLGALANRLVALKQQGMHERTLAGSDLTIDFQRGGRALRIVFDSLSFDYDAAGLRLTSTELYLLEK